MENQEPKIELMGVSVLQDESIFRRHQRQNKSNFGKEDIIGRYRSPNPKF